MEYGNIKNPQEEVNNQIQLVTAFTIIVYLFFFDVLEDASEAAGFLIILREFWLRPGQRLMRFKCRLEFSNSRMDDHDYPRFFRITEFAIAAGLIAICQWTEWRGKCPEVWITLPEVGRASTSGCVSCKK